MPRKFSVGDLLNKQFEKPEARPDGEQSIHTQVSTDGSRFVVREIPLAQIRRSDKNLYGIRDVEELATSIEAVGLMHNIVVRETDEPNVYELISGERRYRAFEMLSERGNDEYTTIPCKIIVEEDDEFSELSMLYANSMARELNDFEKMYQAVRTREILQGLKQKGYKFKGRLRDVIAEMFDVSSAQVSRMQRIHDDLIPGFMDEFKKEEIGIRAAYDLAVLPKDEQVQVLAEYKEAGTEAIRKATQKTLSQKEESTWPDGQAVPTVKEETPQAPRAEQDNPPVGNEKRAAEPTRANKAQRNVLIGFGRGAVRELFMTSESEELARIKGAIKAMTDIASAFGIRDYDAKIHSISE